MFPYKEPRSLYFNNQLICIRINTIAIALLMVDKIKKTPIEKCFTENESALKRFLERYLYNVHDVEDILQETFLQTWMIEKKQKIQLPKSYLFSVARNMALKELRKKSRHLNAYLVEINSNSLLSNEPIMDGGFEFNERLCLFEKALCTLSPQCKKVFVLRKVFGFSQKEIARRMDISESTVEKHISNGLQRCNVYMRAYGVDDLSKLSQPKRREGTRDKVKEP